MNDKKIRDKYRNKYHDFVNKKIISTANETLLDDKQTELLVYKNANSDIGINTPLVILKQKYSSRDEKTGVTTDMSRSIEYTPSEGYRKAFGDERGSLTSEYMRTVKVSNQSSFFDFIAVCINKDASDYKNFAITKEDLFNHLRGLIDNERYVNQRRAVFEPSKFPEMSVWRQSEYYDFVDSQFTQELFKNEHDSEFITVVDGHKFMIVDGKRMYLGEASDITAHIREIDLKQQFIHFSVGEGYNPHVYTSSSKYYNKVTSQQATTFIFGGTKPSVTKIENNNPYFMFILRCLNKDKKVFEPVLRRGRPVQYKEFTQRELSAYLDGFISNEEYIKEYDITFVPIEVNPGVDESSKKKYVDFVEKEIKPKVKNMWMVSADDDSVFFAQHYGTLTAMGSKIDNTPEHDSADVVLTPYSRLNSYRKKSGQEVYGIPDDNPNFKFIRECLSHNGTESKWIQFVPTREEHLSGNNKDLLQRLEKLPFNQQCKEDYLNNFMSLPGSSSGAVSTTSVGVAPTALLLFVLYQSLPAAFQTLSAPLSSLYNYISNKINGQGHINDGRKEERYNNEPSSNMTEAREQQLDKKGIMK